jgi:protein-L-isoaspartate O-methyltransferase
MNYTATYSPEDDKLRLYCGRVDPETYARLRKVRFQRAYKQECFYVVWNPAAEDICLELAGSIDDEDTSLVDRAEARADRFEGYSEKRTREAESAHAQVDQIAERFSGGQPILIGHHSEKRARKDAERIENGMRKALKLWDTASYWTDRAAGALRHAKYLERPTVRARQIKGLESDVRVYRSKFTPIGEPIMQHRWNEYGDDKPKIPHVFCAPRGGRGGHYVPVEDLPGIERHYSRWIKHAENRLAYERAMLAEAGASDLLKPKPRSKAASLPLCNYRAPEGLTIENKWHRGEMLLYPQKEMTAAEFARINADYKGTRVVGNSHRVRTAMLQSSLWCVFITDAKTHVPPGAIEAEPVTEPRRFPVMVAEPSEVEKKVAQLRAAVNAGVKVVAAPQLFPTPVPLAERMVNLADIRPGHRVLEPEAGTGRILAAIVRAVLSVDVVGVELNYNLAAALTSHYPDPAISIRQADFLECNGDLGKFDRILMNPPFQDGADIHHIRHAIKFLAPGGRLVAIAAGGPRQHEQLKPIAATWEPLPAGTFADEGTNVSSVLLTIDAPAATHEPQAITGQTLSLFPEGE